MSLSRAYLSIDDDPECAVILCQWISERSLTATPLDGAGYRRRGAVVILPPPGWLAAVASTGRLEQDWLQAGSRMNGT
ncbi:MAG: hypothetical protein GX885_09125 [Methanomicrobiales archaeon]|nr:hypothetical protein [Methanomicrobiales archaeon]